MSDVRISWSIPCLNEEKTIGKVVDDIRACCPGAEIHVFDNRSTDRTSEIARARGAQVHRVFNRGKGWVVKRMFEIVDADIYIIVDGDDTYDVTAWKSLVEPLLRQEGEMAVAVRPVAEASQAFRRFHSFGNRFLTGLLNATFHQRLTDTLSGYRAFTRDLVSGIPLSAKGFEIEVELTIQSVDNGFQVIEVPLAYRSRPPGSQSKLRTFRDGFIIAFTILRLFKDYKPLSLCGLLATFCAIGAFASMFWASWRNFAIAGSVISVLLLVLGLVLNSISQRSRELAQIIRKSGMRALGAKRNGSSTELSRIA